MRKAATHIGWHLLAPRHHRLTKRLGSLLFHWGAERIDLHVETYGRIP